MLNYVSRVFSAPWSSAHLTCTLSTFPSELTVSFLPIFSFASTQSQWPWPFTPIVFRFICVIVIVLRFLTKVWESFLGRPFGWVCGFWIFIYGEGAFVRVTWRAAAFLWTVRGFCGGCVRIRLFSRSRGGIIPWCGRVRLWVTLAFLNVVTISWFARVLGHAVV